MLNSPRDTNFNPNDNTGSKKQEWFRYAAWTMFGHPRAILFMILWFIIAPKLDTPAFITFAVFVLIPIIESRMFRRGIGPPRLVMWANVVRFRRYWFTIWTANTTAKTDHTTQGLGLLPVLSITPRFKGNIGYFTVRPPSGHTLDYVAEIADMLAAHSPGVTQIEIIYDSPTDSKGTLQAVFGGTLKQSTPTLTPILPATSPPTDTFTNDIPESADLTGPVLVPVTQPPAVEDFDYPY